MGEALVQAVEEVVEDISCHLQSTGAAWSGFLLKVSACIILAGTGANFQQEQQDGLR